MFADDLVESSDPSRSRERTSNGGAVLLRSRDENRRHITAAPVPSELLARRGLSGNRYDLDMDAERFLQHLRVDYLLSLSEERRRTIRVYLGHFPYVACELLGLDLTKLSLVREPVNRTVAAPTVEAQRPAAQGLDAGADLRPPQRLLATPLRITRRRCSQRRPTTTWSTTTT